MPILYRYVDIQQKQVRYNAELWADAASQALVEFEAMGEIKKNVGDPAFTFLLEVLFQIYEEGTGKKASRSIDPHTKKYTGPMIRFIEDCLDLLGAVKKSNKALGLAIDRQLKKKKSMEESPPFCFIPEHILRL